MIKLAILFYTLLFIIVLLLAFLLKDRNLFITILCSLLIIQIILSPKLCIDGAINGVILFFYKVFPSLFSFLIVSNIIINCNGIYIYAKLFGKVLCSPLNLPRNCSFALIISMLCGYPLGAKYACDLYENDEIDNNTFTRLLNIASNSSPLFILGSVGISMFKNSVLGYILLLSNLISCFIMGFILPSKVSYNNNNHIHNSITSNSNIGNILKRSIENSIKTCLSIGGFVTMFSVINGILEHNLIFEIVTEKISNIFNISSSIIKGTILGIIEMTNGCNLITTSDGNIYIKILIISFLFTFSGFSIISQVYSFTYKFKISMGKYIFRKIIHGIICAILSLFIFKIYESKLISKEIFSYYYSPIVSSDNIFMFLIGVIIFPVILFKLKNLFNIF